MSTLPHPSSLLLAVCLFSMLSHLPAADSPRWGRDNARNMVSDEKGLPSAFNPGKKKAGSDEIDPATVTNLAWAAKIGSQCYGTPMIAGGTVYIGTNNESPRNPNHIGDRGVVMAFDEYSGEFKWQLITPKLGAGKVSDWEYLGMCSTPQIIGDRGYVITNRCEILCLDIKGLADGNQGMTDEALYMTAPGKDGTPHTPKVLPIDADILWFYDMRKELGVFPHNIASNYPLVHDGKVYASTSNGVDWSHTNIPAPSSPSLICLDAATGTYEAEVSSIISERVLHCSWSSPALGTVKGAPQIFFGAGDGWIYG
ncbi:MAG: pyrrolo-quinoline quinone, partial [Prosthecobacter sp.]